MFCSKCGRQLKGDIKFCPDCGNPVEQGKGLENSDFFLCCPRCGSTKLSMTQKRDYGAAVTSAVAVSAITDKQTGLLAAGSNLQQKTYWICAKCGKQFRSPDELEAEVKTAGKMAKGFRIFSIIMLVCAALLAISSFVMRVYFLTFFLCFAVFRLWCLRCFRVTEPKNSKGN